MTMAIALPSGQHATSHRELAVLRALGRLGPTRMDHLSTLVLADLAVRTRQVLMQRLLSQGLIWVARISDHATVRADGPQVPPRSQRVFGLTVAGRDQLDGWGVEPDAPSLEQLVVHCPQETPLAQFLLPRDVLVSAWCVSVLDQARRVPTLVGARCQAQFVPARDPGTGQALQTMGAYVELIFNQQQLRADCPPWQVPWQVGPAPVGSQVVRWGLEADTGVQTLARFSPQALTYAALQPLYTTVLGGPVTPVLLTPSAGRAAQVMQAWRAGWPETTALCASVDQANHPTLGVLWGTYLTVKDDPPQPTSLLHGLVDDPRQAVP